MFVNLKHAQRAVPIVAREDVAREQGLFRHQAIALTLAF